MPNLLRTEASERIDLTDWDYTNRTAIDAQGRIAPWAVLTNPTGAQRSWILSGFAMTVPPLTQSVQVTRGVAILAQRTEGEIRYGSVAAEGATSRTVDISTYPNATTYSIYIRFEYVDSDTQNRIFWNPSGLGSEYARSIDTRRAAEWSVRIESASPGPEWLKIGQVFKSVSPPVITDMRPLYFEGFPTGAYASGWSSDGGGSSNDRNAARSTYGITDFQTFTAAMRQCLEDIKGRGLRRWWDRSIGGMNIGFDAAPTEDALFIGDANMGINHASPSATSTPEIQFYGTSNRLLFSRTSNYYEFQTGGVLRQRLDPNGIRSVGGLVLGYSGVPTANAAFIGDANFGLNFNAGTPRIVVNSGGDYLQYTRTSPGVGSWDFVYAGVNKATISNTYSSFTGNVFASGNVYAGGGRLLFGVAGTDDYLEWDGTSLNHVLDNVNRFYLRPGNAVLGSPGVSTTPGFHMRSNWMPALGNTAGNTRAVTSFDVLDGNQDQFLTYMYREANAPSDWTTASWYLHRVVDATYFGFLKFAADANYGGLGVLGPCACLGSGGGLAPGAAPTLAVGSNRARLFGFLEIPAAYGISIGSLTATNDRLTIGDNDCFFIGASTSGNKPGLQLGASSYLQYDRGASTFNMVIGGSTEFSLNNSGSYTYGNINVMGNIRKTSATNGLITVSGVHWRAWYQATIDGDNYNLMIPPATGVVVLPHTRTANIPIPSLPCEAGSGNYITSMNVSCQAVSEGTLYWTLYYVEPLNLTAIAHSSGSVFVDDAWGATAVTLNNADLIMDLTGRVAFLQVEWQASGPLFYFWINLGKVSFSTVESLHYGVNRSY